MAKLSKLQKFAAIRTFPNVYSSESYDSPRVLDHRGQARLIKGQWNAHFGNDKPIILEVACGKGHYARGLAEMYPEYNYIGVELKGNRLYTGAVEFYFEKGEVEQIWITFPDPQLGKPRKRVTAPRFLQVYRNILAANNQVHLKTDSPDLYQYTLEILEEAQITPSYQRDDIYAQPLDFPALAIKTFYEEMHLEDERTIKNLRFSL